MRASIGECRLMPAAGTDAQRQETALRVRIRTMASILLPHTGESNRTPVPIIFPPAPRVGAEPATATATVQTVGVAAWRATNQTVVPPPGQGTRPRADQNPGLGYAHDHRQGTVQRTAQRTWHSTVRRPCQRMAESLPPSARSGPLPEARTAAGTTIPEFVPRTVRKVVP